MFRSAIVIVLALEASALFDFGKQVNDIAPKLNFDALRRRLDAHGDSAVPAALSDACAAACPGMPGLIAAMSSRRLDGHDRDAFDTKNCVHMDAMVCLSGTAACQDSGKADTSAETKSNLATMTCMCACPALAAAKTMDDNCAVVPCAKATSACTALFNNDPKDGGIDAIEIQCAAHAAGCTEKNEGVMTCTGTDKMMSWGACEAASKDGTFKDMSSACCPILETLYGCVTKECVDYDTASKYIQAQAGNTEAKASLEGTYTMGQSCGNVDLPTSSAEAKSLSDAQTGASGDGASTDLAVHQAAPALAMVATIVALVA